MACTKQCWSKSHWSDVRFIANSFPLFIKQRLINAFEKFQKFSDWKARQEQWVSLGAVWGVVLREGRFPAGFGLGWAQCQGMSTATAETTQRSTTSESLCNSIQPRSLISWQTTWISTLLLVWHAGWEWDEFLIFTNTKEGLSSKAALRLRSNDKTTQAYSIYSPTSGFWEHCRCVAYPLPLLTYCNNQHSPTFSGKWWHSLCSYSTKYYGSSTWLHLLTWQSAPHLSPRATSKHVPFVLFDGQCKWERARHYQ